MKRLLLITSALVLAFACTNKTLDNDPWGKINPDDAGKQSKTLDSSMESSYMHRSMTYSVWLPAEYDESKTYPFLYLLHGYETNDQNGRFNRCWLDKGNAAMLADSYQKSGGVAMVIVMPNGLDKFYMNDGYEDFFEKEFLPQMEQLYHCNGQRAIAGLSMGGHGTLYHALKYPEKFTYAYAMSPYADYIAGAASSLIAAQSDISVFPAFTIEVGTMDFTVKNNLNKNICNTLTNKGIACEWIERAGTHDWAFWKACLPKALKKAGESFQ